MNVHPSVSSPRGEAQRRIKDSLDAQQVTVILGSGDPNSLRLLRARFVAQIGVMLKLQLTAALGESVTVGLAGEIQTAGGSRLLKGHYRVRSCRSEGIGRYLVDLEPQIDAGEESRNAGGPAEDPDHYELLQVSRHADTDTIHRVYHVLAQRYHPDNAATGNAERFRQASVDI